MKLTADCPCCGKNITLDGKRRQEWLYCSDCQCIFISRDSLRKNWPSLYEALEKKKVVSAGTSAN